MIKAWVEKRSLPKNNKKLVKRIKCWSADTANIDDDGVLSRVESKPETALRRKRRWSQVVIPESMRNRQLASAYSATAAADFGRERSEERLRLEPPMPSYGTGHIVTTYSTFYMNRMTIDKMVNLIEQHYEWQGKSFILDISTLNRVSFNRSTNKATGTCQPL